MSLLPGNRLSKILSSTLAKIFLLHFQSATALLVFKAPSSAMLTPQHWSYVLSVTTPLVCPESIRACLKGCQKCRCSPAFASLPWEPVTQRSRPLIPSWLSGNLRLVPLLATRSLSFERKRRRFAQHHDRAQARAPGGGTLLGFNPSNKQNHSNFHKEGDQDCSAGNEHKKVSEILYRIAKLLFGKGDAFSLRTVSY